MHMTPSKIQTHCACLPSLKTPLGAEVTSRKKSNKVLKFIYSEKATKFCLTLLLSYVVPVKSKVKILQNFVAFSEYMNFTTTTTALGILNRIVI